MNSPAKGSADVRAVLPSLGAGDVGIVLQITAGQAAAKRLADMGFVGGARIEMVQPGAPCIVRINGTCVALGTRHQESIHLTRV